MKYTKSAIDKAVKAYEMIYGVTLTPWQCERLLSLLEFAHEADEAQHAATAPVVVPPPPKYDPDDVAFDGWGPWIEWHGGDCPVAGDIVVKCKLNRGNKFALMIRLNANDLNWIHYEDGLNIVAYCVKL